MRAAWPLIGRDSELTVIRRALETRDSHGVVIAGTAGVGKSRLLQAACEAATALGWTTATASATRANASLPFGPLAHLLPDALPMSGARPSHTNVLRLTARSLMPAEGQRLVLAIDDAHLLDPQSAALTGFLSSDDSVFIAVTVRTGEATPDAITSLWTDGDCRRIDLQPLSQKEFETLLNTLLPPLVAPPTRDRLWEATQGNPLFLRELIAGAREDGHLVREHEAWTWRGPFGPHRRLIELIEDRVLRAPPAVRRVLDVVAIAESIGLEFLLEAVPAEAIDDGTERGLLQVNEVRRRVEIGLSHPLFGEVLRARMPPVRARRISRWLADAVEAIGGRRGEDLLRLAIWRLDGGGPIDPELLTAASRRAVDRADPHLGERLAQASLDAGGGTMALVALAETLVQQGRFEEADVLLASVADERLGGGERAVVATARAMNLFYHLDRTDLAVQVLADAGRAAREVGASAELDAAMAHVLLWSGKPQAALDITTKVLDRRDAPVRAQLVAAMTAHFAASSRGKPLQALSIIDRALPLAESRPDDTLGALEYLRTGVCAALFYAGRLLEAEACMNRRDEAGAGTYYMRGASLWGLGWILRIQGRPRSALEPVRRCLAVLREVDLFGARSAAHGELAQCLALLGDAEGAEAAFAESKATQRASNRLVNATAKMAATWVAVARGDLSTARQEALAAAAYAERTGDRFNEALALHDAARLGAARRVAARMARLAADFEGDLIPAVAMHVDALASGDPARLIAASAAFEAIGARLFAAEAAAAAAAAFERSGRSGSAAGAAIRAQRLTEACEGARTPPLALIGPTALLTRREREIAELAARGLSSREIAARLVLSPRTVDNHLRSVYAKLGVDGRGKLASILHTPDSAPRAARIE